MATHSLLDILRQPSYLTQVVHSALPLQLQDYTDHISAAIVMLVWVGISVAIVKLSRKTSKNVVILSPVKISHTATTEKSTRHSPRIQQKEEETTKVHSHSVSSPNRITATTYEVSEANIIKDEPVEEIRASRSTRKAPVPLPSIGSPARISARSIKTPERFSPGGKMLSTDAALRPRAHRSGIAKSITFDS